VVTRMPAVTLFCAVLASLSGCCPAVWQAYPGDARAASDVARLVAAVPELRIHAVDGEPTMCLRDTGARAVDVAPGEHDVTVRWCRPETEYLPGYGAVAVLRIDAVAGRTYQVSGRAGLDGASFMVMDAETGRVVSATGR